MTDGLFRQGRASAFYGKFWNSGPLARASVKGTVKWFNVTKGYGFITLDDGAEAFCHASALQALGAPSLQQGATIVCDLQDSPRGLQVVAVHSIAGGAPEEPSRAPRADSGRDRFGSGRGADRFGGNDRFGNDARGGGDRFSGNDRFGGDRFSGGHRDSNVGQSSGSMLDGKVKFFNDQKGFGFVMPDNGGGDVYLHATALRRSGVQVIEPEQRIRFSTRQGNKGVEVDKVELI